MSYAKHFYMEWRFQGPRERFFMSLGVLFFILTLIGLAIPLVPQVPFAIISAYFFSKGSKRIHLWMRTNRFFGRPVREWEDFRVIRPKMKAIASISLVMSAVIGHLKLVPFWALSLDLILAISLLFILTRKSKIFTFFGSWK